MPNDEQWTRYASGGYLHLGRVLEPAAVEALKQRADDLALGRVQNPLVQLQADTGGVYKELPAVERQGERSSIFYRKIQGLENDDLFAPLVRHPVCREICAHEYGAHAPVSIFRAMIMNKPAGQGTHLPWHQDGGAVWKLDRDPLVTFWVALDTATRANGCLEVIPGSHRLGLLSTFGSTVRDEDVALHCPPEKTLPLEVEAGHAVLIHNWLIHRSGINPSPVPRRAFTACYMDGRTLSTLTGDTFPMIWGTAEDLPYLFVRHLTQECAVLRDSSAAATEYARSLEGEVEKLRAALAALQTQTGGQPMAAGSMPPRREKRGLGRWFGG